MSFLSVYVPTLFSKVRRVRKRGFSGHFSRRYKALSWAFEILGFQSFCAMDTLRQSIYSVLPDERLAKQLRHKSLRP
jgi:hypothetical protein